MKTIEQQIAVMQHFADGGEVEQKYVYGQGWAEFTGRFDWMCFDYRIKEPVDPYAELKAAAKDPTKQIRFKNYHWKDAGYPWDFDGGIDNYKIRNKPRTVKLLAWFNGIRMDWSTDAQTHRGRKAGSESPKRT